MITASIADLLIASVIFVFSLLLVVWLHLQIYKFLTLLVSVATGSMQRGFVLYFLLMLPGIIVHEGAHWVVARLLGLKPGRFRVWPKLQRNGTVQLGSITARPGGIWLDSLVGMAPIIVGSVLIALISQHVFGAGAMIASVSNGDIVGIVNALKAALAKTDSPLWAYLLFTIANGMMPSTPDREPLKPALGYTLLALVVYILLGLPLTPLTEALIMLIRPLQLLNIALILVILLNFVVFALLALLTKLLIRSG